MNKVVLKERNLCEGPLHPAVLEGSHPVRRFTQFKVDTSKNHQSTGLCTRYRVGSAVAVLSAKTDCTHFFNRFFNNSSKLILFVFIFAVIWREIIPPVFKATAENVTLCYLVLPFLTCIIWSTGLQISYFVPLAQRGRIIWSRVETRR